MKPAWRPISFTSPMPSDAARLGMGAVEHAGGFLDGGDEAERAARQRHVVVDRLGHADTGERLAPAARFLVERSRRAGCRRRRRRRGYSRWRSTRKSTAPTISTGPREEPRIVPPFLMDAVDKLGREGHRRRAAAGIEPAVAIAESRAPRPRRSCSAARGRASGSHCSVPGTSPPQVTMPARAPRVEENFARGPASSNCNPGSTPTSMCSGMRSSSLIA